MKLYEMRSAPNPRRVRIFLAEKGIQVETVQLDLQAGDNLSDEFRQKNPMAKVPVLELDDGTCISEVTAICRYFEALEPEPNLLGETPLEQAQIEMWQSRLQTYFLTPTAMCFQHSSGYFSDRMNPVAEWGEENRAATLTFLTYLDRHLADHDWISGDRFTIADITALCTVDFNRVNNIRIDDSLPNIQRWHQTLQNRPSIRA